MSISTGTVTEKRKFLRCCHYYQGKTSPAVVAAAVILILVVAHADGEEGTPLRPSLPGMDDTTTILGNPASAALWN
jgi:hypothetical protein